MKRINRNVVLLAAFIMSIVEDGCSDTPPNLELPYQLLQPQGPQAKPKQTIQQFQVAVVLPPGVQKPPQGNQPEYVWFQVPASLLTQGSPSQSPDVAKPRPTIPPFFSPVSQNPPAGPDIFMTLKPPSAPIVPPAGPDTFLTLKPPSAPIAPPAGPDTFLTLKPPSAPIAPPAGPDAFLTLRPPSAPVVPGLQQPFATESTPVEVLLRKCLKPRGQFQTNSCNKYVNCWDGVAVEQFCPEGLVFHGKGYCDYPYNVNCGGRPIEGIPPPPTPLDTTTNIPAQASSQAPTTAPPPTVIVSLPTIDPSLRKLCVKPRGQFRSKTCNKYVNCWDDVIIEQECPEGLLFSNKGYCDFPASVDCQNATIPTKSGVEFDKDCPIEFGTFREKLDCRNYFTCIGWKVVARYNCPEGFSFNDNIGVCDYAERVDCSKEPLIFLPKSNFLSNVPKDFMQKIDECKPGSVFALNQQCTAACLCHDGVSEVVQCPSGLAYDIQTDKCLLPHLAKC